MHNYGIIIHLVFSVIGEIILCLPGVKFRVGQKSENNPLKMGYFGNF